jgi:hypothetical protein
VSTKVRAWQFILLVALLCGASIWGVVWYRSRFLSTATLLRRMPTEDALLVYIDCNALRQIGLLQMLAGSKSGQEPDYQTFVRRTQFDYQQDLESVLLAAAPTGNYFFVRGRFDWKSLRTYAEAEEGHCNNSFCKVPGSSPERHISFFPVQSGLMAIAASTDDSAAWRLSENSKSRQEGPSGPVWMSIPPRILKASDSLPSGTSMFARTLDHADSVTLTFAPEGDRFAARLNVRCRNPQDAADIAAQLAKTTTVLRAIFASEKRLPNPGDLSGPLANGVFRSEGARVYGYWPFDRVLVESLLGGS